MTVEFSIYVANSHYFTVCIKVGVNFLVKIHKTINDTNTNNYDNLKVHLNLNDCSQIYRI